MSNSDASVFLTLAGFGLLLTISMCSSPLAGGDMPIGYPHTVQGEVVKDPKTRYIRTDSGGQEKVSLTIKPDNDVDYKVTRAASSSNDTLVVECLSTRCTQIVKGENHSLSCRVSGRWLEPNVVVCKHKREN